ncbi:MAG: glycosyltransferase family 4 protein [Caldilineaceae bacterium]
MAQPSRSTWRLLAVGPKPPPLNGTSVSFQNFCDEVARYADQIQLTIIDTAPPQLKEKSKLFTFGNLSKVLEVLGSFLGNIGRTDRVIIVGSHQFLLTAGALCLFIARLFGKPCAYRTFGYMDRYYESLSPAMQWFFRFVMGRLDNLIVETELSYNNLKPVLGNKVSWIGGFRPMLEETDETVLLKNTECNKLRLASLGQVREDKGIFVLLESLRDPRIQAKSHIQCDIYGPLFQSISERFEEELSRTPNAHYCGIVNAEEAVATLSDYDALIFPTFYKGEGHPGVIMEAMMAGIPVITTSFRSIPELIHNGENGLLVPPHDAKRLADAIEMVDLDRPLLEAMGQRNWEKRTAYDVREVVPLILQKIGISVAARDVTLDRHFLG